MVKTKLYDLILTREQMEIIRGLLEQEVNGLYKLGEFDEDIEVINPILTLIDIKLEKE